MGGRTAASYQPGDHPPEDLGAILQQFYAELRKKNRDEYEPELMQTALERHLREAGCCYSILKDEKFQISRRVKSDLLQQGKGKRPMKADSLSIEDEPCLWRLGVIGIDNPTSLHNILPIQREFRHARSARASSFDGPTKARQSLEVSTSSGVEVNMH